ncbi:MAG: GDP-mannose 4,6-dehydratase, partial [Deltaproteobacteria bacterium]|nr:GDP-mannose 4,6-dehydratase [Deltaproteobacteria bacterium]
MILSTDTAVREFVELAFKEVGIEICWKGRGVHEKGYDKKSGKIIIQIDPRYFRPADVDFLLGDPTKAKTNLGWQPKMSFEELVKTMVEADLKENEGELYLKNASFK